MKSPRFEGADTIAAISTPPGEGGVGIVRLSGARALEIADSIFRSQRGRPVSQQRGFTAQFGHIVERSGDHEEKIDEALALVMRSPRSYTREDVVELSCHGGRVVLQKVLELCVRAGARLAEPGEFTRRAFLNGRIDLAQAEAVLEIIRAKTDLALKIARTQLDGALSHRIRKIRDDLARVLSHMDAAIDFPDDRIDPMNDMEIRRELLGIDQECEDLMAHARGGRLIREGLKTVLVGKPNVGKSSLMNTLVRSQRVLVSPQPGTTRDSIEEQLLMEGLAVRLVDTAGLKESESEIERLSMERTQKEIETGDLILFVVDASGSITRNERMHWESLGDKPRFLIFNKWDLVRSGANCPNGIKHLESMTLCTSCVTGTGMDELERKIAAFIRQESRPISEETWVLSVRHADLFRKAKEHIGLALRALEEDLSVEFAAVDIRIAMDRLGEIVGAVVTDDILDLVFSQFCIGK